ncbi:MAG TPA: SGNH/GDSL hydrolase family protein [Mycobacteriales bacterium]|jgi:lysophospholipase L1-like esterase|nr:SGNH/GDSL hydrolase family protein [Mycobacteriales bacterium]
MRRTHVGLAFLGAVGVGVAAVALAVAGPASPAVAGGTWVGSWEAAPASSTAQDPEGFPNVTVRNVVHLSVGGNALRVHLSNLFGRAPLHVGNATVAVAAAPSSPQALYGTLRPLTFDGSRTPTIPVGADLVSDPVPLRVGAGSTLLVSTFTTDPQPLTFHSSAEQTSFVARSGDHATDESGRSYNATVRRWYLVDGVDVRQPESEGAVVAFGDSITDGFRSTTGANRRWPDDLARRLAPLRIGVLNAGISGNRVLLDGDAPGGPGAASGQSALTRFDRDVLSRPGVRTVILLEGVNDLRLAPQQLVPVRIEAGLAELAARAHARGIRVVGGTLTPFGDSFGARPQVESARSAINTWIRHTRDFDAVVDFDRALRDPAHPERLRRSYDSGDHLHPNDAGYQAMSEAVPLAAVVDGKPSGAGTSG